MFAPLVEFYNFGLYSILMDAYSVDMDIKSKQELSTIVDIFVQILLRKTDSHPIPSKESQIV